MHEPASYSVARKSFFALLELARRPVLARRLLSQAYNERILSRGNIPTAGLAELVRSRPEITLVDFAPEHGNVSAFELMCLCMLVRDARSKHVLELGTFNGNTALQLAANLSEGSLLTTIDLPPDADPVSGNNEHDAILIRDRSRSRPRYLDTRYADRVRQVYGDTLRTDFSAIASRPPDFVFIDAGHTTECVRNDTEKSLAVLASGGIIAWHDYTQDWPDVFNYLNELSYRLPLTKIAGTSIVVYRDRGEAHRA